MTTDIEEAIARGHPSSNLFPMLSDAELWDLADDVGRNGLNDAIVVFEGLILDGRNRWVACMRAGVAPRTVTWDGRGGSPTAYVISKNLHRRHLSPSQRAAVAAEALPLFEAEAQERMLAGAAPDPPANLPEGQAVTGEAREFASKQFDVSPRYIQDAKRLRTGDPDAFERVKAGKLTLSQAKRESSDFLMPEREEASPEERAYYALSRQRLVVSLEPDTVAGFCADAGLSLESFGALEAWLGRFNTALRERAGARLQVVR